MEEILEILKDCTLNPPTSKTKIKSVEIELGIHLPNDYVAFLLHANGGEGPIGEDGYIRLWGIEEIPKLNREYQFNIYAPGFWAFGSDGGGESIAFDFRNEEVKIVLLPFIGMSPEKNIFISNNFRDFIEKYEASDFWP